MLPGDMSVRGSLRTMTAEDLLDWIDRRSMDGVLTVQETSSKKPLIRSFVFDSGYISSAQSNESSTYLGRLLLGAGAIDEAGFKRAVTAQAKSGKPLAAILHSLGGVDEEALRSAVVAQAREAILDTLTWTSGEFAFEPAGGRPTEVAHPLQIRLRACIVEGRKRALRWKQIHRLIPGEDSRLQVADRTRLSAADDAREALEEIVEIVAAVEQMLPIREIIRTRHGRRFAVLNLLARLVERGGLRLAPEGSAEPVVEEDDDVDLSSVESLTAAAGQRAADGDRGKAYQLARRALSLAPHEPELQKLVRRLERALFAELSRDLLSSFRVPKLLVERAELDNLKLDETERYLAGRVDGRWDLLSLMRVAPVREVEALITFKRLADRGIISL